MKGLILHKPINLGPLRINISKTGVGFSLALPFKGRVGRNALGKWYYDVTIINLFRARIRFRRNLDAMKKDLKEAVK